MGLHHGVIAEDPKRDAVADKQTYISGATKELHDLTTEVYEGLMDGDNVERQLDEIISAAQDLKNTFYESKIV